LSSNSGVIFYRKYGGNVYLKYFYRCFPSIYNFIINVWSSYRLIARKHKMFTIFYNENTINIANLLCFICFLCLLLDLIPEVKYYACYQGGDNLSKNINKLMSIHSKDIVFNLFKCCVTFYIVYYAVGSLVFASFRCDILPLYFQN
jgi:hypothetical protein